MLSRKRDASRLVYSLPDVCAQYLIDHAQKIGGVGKTVEIDESKFGKSKYNRGRIQGRSLGVWWNRKTIIFQLLHGGSER